MTRCQTRDGEASPIVRAICSGLRRLPLMRQEPGVELGVVVGLGPGVVDGVGIDGELDVRADAFRASTISCDRASGTVGSLAPWKTQIGRSLSFGASLGLPPPQIGAMAANRSGWAAARAQVPKPPMLRPVR